jgi:hypothetical protein
MALFCVDLKFKKRAKINLLAGKNYFCLIKVKKMINKKEGNYILSKIYPFFLITRAPSALFNRFSCPCFTLYIVYIKK